MSGKFVRAAAGLAMAASSAVAQAAYQLNLQEPASHIGERVHDLHTIILVICLAIFIGVFGVLGYSLYAHRKSKGHVAAQFHENTTVEVLWTVIPFVILVLMAWPATTTLLAMRDTTQPDITIKVTGYQWKWGYDYLKGDGEGISFLSNLATPHNQIYEQAPKGENYLLEVDNPLVVPVGRKIRVLTTGNDVIHAWYVPALAVKQDANPGFIRDAWFRADREGTYRGQCAELCGKDHAFMPIVVEVVSQEKYAAWVGEQKKKMAALAEDPNKTWDLAALAERGEKVYQANCVACHQPNGKGQPPAFPALSGSKLVNGPKADQIGLVLNGKQGTAMASFKQLSDVELAAVITYTRNSWANKTGEAVLPAEVTAARK
ncbi:MAG: cytochrome c oxidase subunit II [Burkholderiales bacterium]|nr:cytochrome c oxidase subunit II [Burkholderiales bacterium]